MQGYLATLGKLPPCITSPYQTTHSIYTITQRLMRLTLQLMVLTDARIMLHKLENTSKE